MFCCGTRVQPAASNGTRVGARAFSTHSVTVRLNEGPSSFDKNITLKKVCEVNSLATQHALLMWKRVRSLCNSRFMNVCQNLALDVGQPSSRTR